VSAASAWEIVIKEALGKLRTTRRPEDAVLEGGFRELPVTFEHVQGVALLPRHHTDPFDRLIIATARVEGLAVVTSDQKFRDYDVLVLEARE
jgi:PIN domain nuclease of toxin-antitoxin system